jgi:tRNA-Thr(GGU) m(6)t(6)A37 methyltransferase TsaA
MIKSNAVLASVATVAIISSILSWRRLAKVEKELTFLRRSDHNEASKTNLGTRAPKQKPNPASTTTLERKSATDNQQECLTVRSIGTVRSVYRLCVGTPRQGLLASSARGRIELHKLGDSSTEEAVSGLEGFSYIWVLFIFHLNTHSSNTKRRFKSKISPPALGGKKVGVFATRSPHRFNPIGITLCKLDRIQIDGPHDVTLYVSGLDLVDGTPVLDIKPYVPVYDSVHQVSNISVGPSSSSAHLSSSSLSTKPIKFPPPCVPEWIDQGLKTHRNVQVTDLAEKELQEILRQDPCALDFYGPHRWDKDSAETMSAVVDCIRQVLAMDVRSSYQTQKTRNGQFQAERAKRIRSQFGVHGEVQSSKSERDDCLPNDERRARCTQQLDNLIIEYLVIETKEPLRGESENSGAEDLIVVESIKQLAKCHLE